MVGQCGAGGRVWSPKAKQTRIRRPSRHRRSGSGHAGSDTKHTPTMLTGCAGLSGMAGGAPCPPRRRTTCRPPQTRRRRPLWHSACSCTCSTARHLGSRNAASYTSTLSMQGSACARPAAYCMCTPPAKAAISSSAHLLSLQRAVQQNAPPIGQEHPSQQCPNLLQQGRSLAGHV